MSAWLVLRLLFAATLVTGLAINAVSGHWTEERARVAEAMVQSPDGTPRPVATPRSLTIVSPASPTTAPIGIADRTVAQQGAAQATIAAYAARDATQATQIAELQAALADARVTATALVVVAANTVLDPTRQPVTIQTDLAGILSNSDAALADARAQLSAELARYPAGCRAGFMLISGNAPDIGQGIALAERVESLLRASWPDIFTEATGAERFAQPNVLPSGEVQIDIFFYSGCQPIG